MLEEVASTALSGRVIFNVQLEYADKVSERGKRGLIIPESFVRGIRHIGYRSNVDAISELIDNSIQAYAERIDLVFGYEEGAFSKKPRQLAIIDDGHGMPPSMLNLAMMWGGTHRENDRSGLGRYGYGLPCATVSIGRRFSIFSKVNGGQLNSAVLDLDALNNGEYRDDDGDIVLPPAQKDDLPRYLQDHVDQIYPGGWQSGTIVLIEKMDRLDWTTAAGLRRNLVRRLGVTYHKLLKKTAIYVDSFAIRSIDPLFLTEKSDLYAIDQDIAQPLDPITISLEAEDPALGEGQITLRYAWLPPTFGAIDKARDAAGLNANARFSILKEYHGIAFSRNGRIVDFLARTPWTTFINNDRYIRIEIEFSAILDELFGVTTSKQQVSLSPRAWDCLREAGLHKAIEQLRAKVRAAKSERSLASQIDKPGVGHVPSSAMSGAATSRLDSLRTTTPGLEADFASQTENGPEQRDGTGRAYSVCESATAKLRSLLACIDARATAGRDGVATEYRALLADWAKTVASAGISDDDIIRDFAWLHEGSRLASADTRRKGQQRRSAP